MPTPIHYDDDYATCVKTFAWLRVMNEGLEPESATRILGIEPTRTQRRGELPRPKAKRPLENGGWFLESVDHVESRDARRHLDWILERLRGKADAIAQLKAQGHRIDLCIRWDSVGHGGPTLDPRQMSELGALDTELWFDVYFAGEDDPD
jgi:hypothetical protein